MRVLTWNLFHGRSDPPAGRPLAREFAAALGEWDWDVALLQEVPPWWPVPLAAACGAQASWALTSRNWLLPVRRAIASRNPDLLKANGGGANAILVRRPPVAARARIRLTWLPERRVAHGVGLADGTWVVNLHATTDPKTRTHADVARARDAALRWAGGAPVVLGGDLNLTHPDVPGFTRVASHHVDHLFVRGLAAGGGGRGTRLDAGALSDHRPLLADVDLRAWAE
jgi:endonuclease/exonuclease/phosphatase family metal-dependent hydrolase